jgi:hypothetical protein
MNITKFQLKQIIKEEVGLYLENDAMEHAAFLQSTLRSIAMWMEENGIYRPEEGVERWLQAVEESEYKDAEDEKALKYRQALLDMSDSIYDYMEQ